MDAGSPEGLGTLGTLIRIGLLNKTVAGGLPVEECGVALSLRSISCKSCFQGRCSTIAASIVFLIMRMNRSTSSQRT